MYSLILSILLFMLPSGAKDPKELKNQINRELAKNKGVFALAYRNLASGEEILINEKINFHAASTMKTPVLIEAYKHAKAGKFSINDSLIIKNEFKSIVDGSAYSLNPKLFELLLTLLCCCFSGLFALLDSNLDEPP